MNDIYLEKFKISNQNEKTIYSIFRRLFFIKYRYNNN